jgi:hypothetical protein
MDNEFSVPTSNKSVSFTRPKIRPGYYAAQLVDVKIRDKDGKLFEKTSALYKSSANFAILEFAIHKVNDDDSIGAPMQVAIDHGTQEVLLSKFVNWRYIKATPDGKQEFSSGFTPGKDGQGSAATQAFKALGWGGPDGNPIDMRSFIGSWAGVMVQDWVDNKDKSIEFSVIDKVLPWKGKTPQNATGTPTVKEEEVTTAAPPKTAELDSRIAELTKSLNDGFLTQRGFDIAVQNLRKEYGV